MTTISKRDIILEWTGNSLSVGPSIHPSACWTVRLSTKRSIRGEDRPSVVLSIRWPWPWPWLLAICTSVHLSAHPSVRLSVNTTICWPLAQPIRPSVHRAFPLPSARFCVVFSACSPVFPSVHLSARKSVFLFARSSTSKPYPLKQPFPNPNLPSFPLSL